MQKVTRGSNNVLIFTFSERVTLSSPYFLMRVNSRATNQTKRFILPSNQSSETGRYDKFTITETSGAETLTSGVVTLTEGDWWYEVFEQTSSTNLNELLSDNVTSIEKGILRVLSTGDIYITSEDIDTYIT